MRMLENDSEPTTDIFVLKAESEDPKKDFALKQLPIVFVVVLLSGCIQPQPTEQLSSSAQSPIIRSVVANPNSVAVGQHCTVVCDAYDPFDEPLTYRWRTEVGDIIGQGNMVRYSAAYCCVGTNRITVTVTNAQGGSTTSFVDVEVR